MPRLAEARVAPAVKKRGGRAIITEKSGIRAVREKNWRKGSREVTAKKRGAQQIKSR